jgi:hypothetical protein
LREALEAVIVIAVLLSLVEAIVSTTSPAETATGTNTPIEEKKTPEQDSPHASGLDGGEELSPPDRTFLVKKLRMQESPLLSLPRAQSDRIRHSDLCRCGMWASGGTRYVRYLPSPMLITAS